MDLYIDTHLDDVIIILFKENKVYKEKIISNEKQNSKLIMPTIKKVLGKNKPNSIIVCNGPGSFTGVRLGVTIAKTLATTLQIPIRSISILETMALCLEDNVDKIVAINDKNGYYVGIFDNDLKLVGNYEYLSNNEFAEYNKKHPVYTNIDLDYNKIYSYAMTKLDINPHEVNPIYIKKIDVEK